MNLSDLNFANSLQSLALKRIRRTIAVWLLQAARKVKLLTHGCIWLYLIGFLDEEDLLVLIEKA